MGDLLHFPTPAPHLVARAIERDLIRHDLAVHFDTIGFPRSLPRLCLSAVASGHEPAFFSEVAHEMGHDGTLSRHWSVVKKMWFFGPIDWDYGQNGD